MYAIIELNGNQYKLVEGRFTYVPLMSAEKNSNFTFDKVLAKVSDKKAKIGSPYIDGSNVVAKILEEVKDKKIIVFKKKRRKGFDKKQGHKQKYTKILVEKIN